MVDLLVLYVMIVMNDAMCTRSVMELCYEMFMELERILRLCDMSCNVSYVICHVM